MKRWHSKEDLAKSRSRKDIEWSAKVNGGTAASPDLSPKSIRTDGSWSDSPRPGVLGAVKRVLQHKYFKILMVFMLVLNLLLIGYETECSIVSDAVPAEMITTLSVCEPEMRYVFIIPQFLIVVAIVLEFLMEILTHARHGCTRWGLMDLCTVALGIARLAVMDSSKSAGYIGVPFLIMCLLRMLRIGKTMPFMIAYPDLWQMIRGLTGAITSVLYALLLAALIVYCFAVVGVTAFADCGEDWHHIQSAMLALFSMASMDGWSERADPVMEAFPHFGTAYVFSFITLVGITLLALVQAVITERSIKAAEDDRRFLDKKREERRKKTVDKLKLLLKQADKNEDGEISKEELKKLYFGPGTASADAKAQSFLKELGEWEEIEKLFDIVNKNNVLCTTVPVMKLCDHLYFYQSDKASFYGLLTLEHLSQLRRKVTRMEGKLDSLREEHRQVNSDLNPTLAKRLRAQLQEQTYKDDRRAARAKRLYHQELKVMDLRTIFETADASCDGSLDEKEFVGLFKERADRRFLERLWRNADRDASGEIDFDEFLEMICEMNQDRFFNVVGEHHLPSDPMESSTSLKHVMEDVARRTAENMAACLHQNGEDSEPRTPPAAFAAAEMRRVADDVVQRVESLLQQHFDQKEQLETAASKPVSNAAPQPAPGEGAAAPHAVEMAAIPSTEAAAPLSRSTTEMSLHATQKIEASYPTSPQGGALNAKSGSQSGANSATLSAELANFKGNIDGRLQQHFRAIQELQQSLTSLAEEDRTASANRPDGAKGDNHTLMCSEPSTVDPFDKRQAEQIPGCVLGMPSSENTKGGDPDLTVGSRNVWHGSRDVFTRDVAVGLLPFAQPPRPGSSPLPHGPYGGHSDSAVGLTPLLFPIAEPIPAQLLQEASQLSGISGNTSLQVGRARTPGSTIPALWAAQDDISIHRLRHQMGSICQQISALERGEL